MKNDLFGSWRANFFTGLAIALPAIISFAVIFWLFFAVSNITDTLLVFIPRDITHEGKGLGPMHWYWSVVALTLTILLISVVGLLARNYMGKKLIQSVDTSLLRVPFLNKIYGTTKQVNEAFTSSGKSSFKTVVMVEFPRAGMYSMGFLTSEQHGEVRTKLQQDLLGVFIPTTPNPTSGFLVLVPEDEVVKLDMSVAEGIKFIISLGSISPEHVPGVPTKIPAGG
ncbi:MAG: hypothetical protein JWR19_4394 [Pedosphaera sp.]|nr:hypothetical protein [Pedosphaera sp.]